MDRQEQSALDELFQLALFTAQNVIRIRKLSYDMSQQLDTITALLGSGSPLDQAKINAIATQVHANQDKLRAALSAVPPPPH
jgi:hypothetical protein